MYLWQKYKEFRKNIRMRIVYIIDSLSNKGGAERVISEKMSYMVTHYGYDVSVITCYQFPENMPNCYYLPDNVRQINLCIPLYLKYNYRYPKRLWISRKYTRQLRHDLEETVSAINPDIIIGVGYTLADVVCQIKSKAAKIIEAHEARQFTKTFNNYKGFSLLVKFFYKALRKKYLHIIEKNANVVVTLTKGDAQNWRKAKRVEIIPNFSTMPISQLSACENKRVIAVGRLEWQKGYDRLIDIWTIVTRKHPDWQLDIYGEGGLETELKETIQTTKLSNISIHHYTGNISIEYATSSICVLTSRYEGFSLVLLEAMRHGVPCITFDCPYGPKDLVDHNKCGYVIENDKIELFTEKLCYLMNHPEIRKQFSTAAVNKAQSYHVDSIMNQWKLLFESLTTKNSL